MKKRLFSLLITVVLLFFISCEKKAGEGGTSTIKGRVKVMDYDYNSFTGQWDLKSEYYAPEEDVYIIYGNDDIYNDDFKTDPEGYYRFQWLKKGTYTLFAYSEDTSGTVKAGEFAVSVQAEITKNNQTFEAPEIVIIK